jgi:hypothetical protein
VSRRASLACLKPSRPDQRHPVKAGACRAPRFAACGLDRPSPARQGLAKQVRHIGSDTHPFPSVIVGKIALSSSILVPACFDRLRSVLIWAASRCGLLRASCRRFLRNFLVGEVKIIPIKTSRILQHNQSMCRQFQSRSLLRVLCQTEGRGQIRLQLKGLECDWRNRNRGAQSRTTRF